MLLNGKICMVILLVNNLVIMYVVESHASLCTYFVPILQCSGLVVWSGSE